MKQISINDVTYFVVNPSRALMNSGLVRDVLATGGLFVVNPATGALEIYRPKKKVYLINFFNGTQAELPADPEVGMLRLEDHFDGNLAIKNFEIKQGEETVYKTTVGESRREFFRQVKYAYHNI